MTRLGLARAFLPSHPLAVSRLPSFTLSLAKEDFKFAAAHFTLFPDGSGELLHGHNFRVRVAIQGARPDAMGLLVEVAAAKREIRAICLQLDEHTLIPEKSSLLEIRGDAESVEVHFGERTYRLPRSDVALLPLENVTIELLARMLWEQLAPRLASPTALQLSVEVEESAGQSCAYQAPLPLR